MKRFYDWFHVFYGLIERGLSANIDAVIRRIFPDTGLLKNRTAIEYACGSGLLGRKLSVFFKSVEGRDSSVNMIRRAENIARREQRKIVCKKGNLPDIREKARSYDYVFISFALHLFSPAQIPSILRKMLTVARKEVIIIDHSLKWGPLTAFIEWIEGSYYDMFIKLDFRNLAAAAGARRFSLESVANCSVLRMSRT